MLKISHSEVDAALLCDRKDYYGAGMNLQRKSHSDSLNRGILTHEVLATFFTHLQQNPNAYADAYTAGSEHLKAAATMNMEFMNTASEVKRLYEFFWASQWFTGYKVIAVEQKYYLPVSDTLTYPFTVDLVLEDAGGNHAIVDHKTTYAFYTDNQIDLAPQLPKYMGGLRALGLRADYALYHQLKHRITKNATHTDVIKVVKFEPSVKRIQTSFTEQIQKARQLEYRRQLPLEEQSNLAIRTANNLVCNSCSFQDLCIADLNGKPTDLLIEAHYTAREERY